MLKRFFNKLIDNIFGKRCKCPREIRDNISVVSDIDINSDSSYESELSYYSDESYDTDDLFVLDF